MLRYLEENDTFARMDKVQPHSRISAYIPGASFTWQFESTLSHIQAGISAGYWLQMAYSSVGRVFTLRNPKRVHG